MDRLIYTAMSGANASAQRQAVLSNNLANASTTGFRAEMATFRAVPVQGDGASTRVFAHEAIGFGSRLLAHIGVDGDVSTEQALDAAEEIAHDRARAHRDAAYDAEIPRDAEAG